MAKLPRATPASPPPTPPPASPAPPLASPTPTPASPLAAPPPTAAPLTASPLAASTSAPARARIDPAEQARLDAWARVDRAIARSEMGLPPEPVPRPITGGRDAAGINARGQFRADSGLETRGPGGGVRAGQVVAPFDEARNIEARLSSGMPFARAEADRLLRDEGVLALMQSDARTSSDAWIARRREQRRAEDARRPPEQQRYAGADGFRRASEDAVRDAAVLRTAGVWVGPAIYYNVDDDSPDRAGAYLSAAAPRVEVVGTDEDGNLILRQQGPGSYAIDLMSMPIYAATATGIPDRAARAVAGTVREAPPVEYVSGPAALRQRRAFSDVAKDTAPTSDLGRATVATLGALADVFTPDPVSLALGATRGLAAGGRALARGAERALPGAGRALERGLVGGTGARALADVDVALERAARAMDDVPAPHGDGPPVPRGEPVPRVDGPPVPRGEPPVPRVDGPPVSAAMAKTAVDDLARGLAEVERALAGGGEALVTEATRRGRAAALPVLSPAVREAATAAPGLASIGRSLSAKAERAIAAADPVALREVVTEAAAVKAAVVEAVGDLRARVGYRAGASAGELPQLADLVGDAVGVPSAAVTAAWKGGREIPLTARQVEAVNRSVAARFGADLADELRVGERIAPDAAAAWERRAATSAARIMEGAAAGGRGAAAAADGTRLGALAARREVRELVRPAPWHERAGALLFPFRGADEAAPYLRAGLSRASREAAIRGERAAAMGAEQALRAGLDTPEAAAAWLRSTGRAEAASRMIRSGMVSQGDVGRALEAIRPGVDRAEVVAQLANAEDPAALLMSLLPEATAAESRALAAWVSATGAQMDVVQDLYGAGLLLTREEAAWVRELGATGRPPDVAVLSAVRKPGVRGSAISGEALALPGQEALGRVTWVPARVREGWAAAAEAVVTKSPPTIEAAIFSAWKRAVTRGLWGARPGYLLNNMYGNIEQVYVTHGLSTAIEYALRAELASVMGIGVAAAPELARVVGAGEAGVGAVRVALGAALGTGKGKAVVEGLVGGGQAAAEAIVVRLTEALRAGRGDRLLHIGALRPTVGRILGAGADDVVKVGGRTYTARSLYEEAARSGVLDGFDVAQLRDGELSGLRALFGGEGVAHLAEVVGMRQRLGLYALLLDRGMPPQQAAKETVRALYDYRYSLGAADRHLIMQALAPFWSWQKNAQRQFLGAFASPSGAFRVGVALRGRREAMELIDAVYQGDYDAQSVGTGRMTPPEVEDYRALVGWMDQQQLTREERVELIRMGATESIVRRYKLPPEIVRGLGVAQQYFDDPAWKARLPGWAQDTATARLARIGLQGIKDPAGVQPDRSPAWSEPLFVVAAPPSGAEATARFTLGLLASVAAIGVSLASDTAAPPATQVFQEQVVDPTRMPILGTVAQGSVTVSQPVYEMLRSLDGFGLYPDLSARTRVIEGQTDPRTRYTVDDPALAGILEATGILAFDRMLQRQAALGGGGGGFDPAWWQRAIGGLGFSTSLAYPGADYGTQLQVRDQLKAVPGTSMPASFREP